MKILINKDGFIASPYIRDADIELEINDTDFEKTSFTPFGYNWRYLNGSFELIPYDYREIREYRCFNIIDNKSQLWYSLLTDTQKQELQTWYQAWLDVTETKVIPEKPEWLN